MPFLVVFALLGLSFGLLALDVERDVVSLLVSRRGRIHRERTHYEEHFESITPLGGVFIITPKTETPLLSPAALREIEALQRWLRKFEHETSAGRRVSLEQICFRAVNGSSALEPCYQSSILNCFSQGDVFNVGEERNAEYIDFYSTRRDSEEFSFERDFTKGFLRESCKAWTGTPNALSSLLGGVEYGGSDDDVIRSVQGLRVAFGIKTPDALVRDGLLFVEWTATGEVAEEDGVICSDPRQCETCAAHFKASRFLRAGCQIGSVTQPATCCEEMGLLRRSPCVQTIFAANPSLAQLANGVLTACGLDAVVNSPRCTNALLMDNTPRATPRPVLVEDELDVCVCLDEPQGSSCSLAAAQVLAARPELQALFMNDGSEDADALAVVLRDVYGCQERLKQAKPPVCVCLDDSASSECETEATAFATSRPEHLNTFLAASQGDSEARRDVGVLLSTLCSVNVAESPPPTVTASATPTPRYTAKTSVDYDSVATVGAAEALLEDWEAGWQKAIQELVQDFVYIEVSWATSNSLNDAAEDAAHTQIPFIAAGYGLVLLYMIVYFSFEWSDGRLQLSKRPPGPFAALLCFLSILLAVLAAFGGIGLLSLTSIKASATTMQVVPLMMVGLGVNDVFVLARALLSALEAAPAKNLEKVMFDAMSVGGTSVTLSSAANAAAFALAMLSPTPMVMAFGLQMVIGVLLTYLVSMTLVPTILAASTGRLLAAGTLSEPLPPIQTETVGSKGHKWWWRCVAAVFVAFAAWLGISLYRLTRIKQGLPASKAVDQDSQLYRYLVQRDAYFGGSTVHLVFSGEQDFSSPANFEAARYAEYAFVRDVYKTEKGIPPISWLDYYSQYIEAQVCAEEICLSEVMFYYDPFSSAKFGDVAKNLCHGVNDPAVCAELCGSYCPQGTSLSGQRCQLSADEQSCYCPWLPVLKPYLFYENPERFDSAIGSYWSDFLTNSSVGLAARNLIDFDAKTKTERNLYGIPKASRSLVSVLPLPTVQQQVRHLTEARATLDAQRNNVYAFNYEVYAIGEQYEGLAGRTMTSVGISLAIAVVVMMPLVAHYCTALLVAGCIASAVVLTAGTAHWLGLHLNYAAFVSLIVTVGLAVEFCAHIAREFMLTEGDRVSRSQRALRSMGIAVLNGGLTTFLGILPLAWSNYAYFKSYYFIQYTLVVITGLFTGLLLLPAVLSIMGPTSFMTSYLTDATEAKIERKQTGP